MKTYIQPNTITLELSARERLCEANIVSVGGNGGFQYGGADGGGYKPM